MILFGKNRINYPKKQHKCIIYDTNQQKEALDCKLLCR
jgi:hypothetical protein